MKIILEYYASFGEGSDDALQVAAFEYESIEKAKKDFAASYNERKFNFLKKAFYGHEIGEWDGKKYKYHEPKFFTLDEWFESNRIN